MKDLRFTIKDRITSNKYLRNLKNHYQDYMGLTQYKINNWRNRNQNQSVEGSVPELSEEERQQSLKDKLNGIGEHPLKVAFVVSEAGNDVTDVTAGDYFTASELGDSLKKFGWEITFLPKEGPENWYYVPGDVDVLISMLESYDPRKIRCQNKSLIKIAWARNWFERWCFNPNLSDYHLIFASSETACDYIEKEAGIKPFLLPIATNPERFNDKIPPNAEYLCDYCFTGSYWDDPRDIMEMLDPATLPYTFKLYGANWDNFPKFRDYYQGFVKYSHMPEVYASTKIVIDDANRGSKKFGAVNSRVYDALASGALVITNGEIGAKETFEGELPVWKSRSELHNLIEFYLNHDQEREEKIRVLKELVHAKHTYQKRADYLKKILKNRD